MVKSKNSKQIETHSTNRNKIGLNKINPIQQFSAYTSLFNSLITEQQTLQPN